MHASQLQVSWACVLAATFFRTASVSLTVGATLFRFFLKVLPNQSFRGLFFPCKVHAGVNPAMLTYGFDICAFHCPFLFGLAPTEGAFRKWERG